MKTRIIKIGLLFCSAFFFSQEITIGTRNDASITSGGTNSGFFQTPTPVNYPSGATGWWYLLDTRHNNPQYAMQFSGSFFDQNLWFRKIDENNLFQGWSKILMEDADGRVGIGGASAVERMTITGGHSNSTFLLRADNGGNPEANLTLWASEPGSTYSGTGIGNNVRNYFNGAAFQRINASIGGSYMRLLENTINFNVISNTGDNKNVFNINADGANVNGNFISQNGNLVSVKGSNEGGAISIMNSLKTGGQFNNWVMYNMTGVYGNSLQFWNYSADGTQSVSRLKLSDDGKMALFGKFEATEVKVTTAPTADFVFEDDYNLPKLEEVEKHIKEKKHLPEIASAKEMEKEGVNIGEFQIKLLQKIEELTLYSIEQNKQIKELKEENETLKRESAGIKTLIERVEKLETASQQGQ